MSKYKNTIFITGSTGNLGSKMVLQLLEENPESKIITLVRGTNRFEAELRLRNLLLKLSPNMDFKRIDERLVVLKGNITEKRLGLSEQQYNICTKNVTYIIHSAAATKFSSTLEESRMVNYSGTSNVLEFAGIAVKSDNFKSMAYISTAYVCGNREGNIFENETDSQHRFLNNYEQSKWETEQLVRSKMQKIPIAIFRPSIIVGDSKTGRILTFNVLYPPLKFMCQGLDLSLPLKSNASLDVIPVDYAARSILHIILKKQNHIGKTYHIVAGKNNSCPVSKIVRTARQLINQRTTVINHTDHSNSLSESLLTRLSKQTKKICRASKFLGIYLPYMTLKRDFDDTNTVLALQGSGISVPPLINYLDKIMEYCVGSNWGKKIRSAA